LPKDNKLLELIRNPFYLNEYLKFYKDKEKLEYRGFKNKLWNKNIRKSKQVIVLFSQKNPDLMFF
jgi:hypothetical protein